MVEIRITSTQVDMLYEERGKTYGYIDFTLEIEAGKAPIIERHWSTQMRLR